MFLVIIYSKRGQATRVPDPDYNMPKSNRKPNVAVCFMSSILLVLYYFNCNS